YLIVTGVQTCALPISQKGTRKVSRRSGQRGVVRKQLCASEKPGLTLWRSEESMPIPSLREPWTARRRSYLDEDASPQTVPISRRSEERRVGKECRNKR